MFRTSSLRCSAKTAAVFCLGAEVVRPIVDSAASAGERLNSISLAEVVVLRSDNYLDNMSRNCSRNRSLSNDLVLYGTRFDERNQNIMLSTTLHINSNTAQPD